jgi:hypothetical protein
MNIKKVRTSVFKEDGVWVVEGRGNENEGVFEGGIDIHFDTKRKAQKFAKAWEKKYNLTKKLKEILR